MLIVFVELPILMVPENNGLFDIFTIPLVFSTKSVDVWSGVYADNVFVIILEE